MSAQGAEPDELDEPESIVNGPHWQAAARELKKRLDDELRRQYRDRVLPWERNVAVGQIDYFKVHAFALDRLDELLERTLPERDPEYDVTYWRGRRDDRSHWIIVSRFSGEWSDPAARKRGRDLVSLVAHVYQMAPSQAAIRLGQWLGVEAIRNG